MADIDVVKKGSRAWLWVMMLIVLALIVWFVWAGNNAPQTGLILDEDGQLQQAAVAQIAQLRV